MRPYPTGRREGSAAAAVDIRPSSGLPKSVVSFHAASTGAFAGLRVLRLTRPRALRPWGSRFRRNSSGPRADSRLVGDEDDEVFNPGPQALGYGPPERLSRYQMPNSSTSSASWVRHSSSGISTIFPLYWLRPGKLAHHWRVCRGRF